MNEIVSLTEMKLIGRCNYSIYSIHNAEYWKIWQYGWNRHICIILNLVTTMALSDISLDRAEVVQMANTYTII